MEFLIFFAGLAIGGVFVFVFLSNKNAALEKRLASLTTENAMLKDQHAEKLEAVRRTQEDFEHHMQSVSGAVLKEVAAQFSENAKKDFALTQKNAAELITKEKEQIGRMAEEITKHLKDTNEKISKTEGEILKQSGHFTSHLEGLSKTTVALTSETQRLKNVLSTSGSVSGRWGETVLENIFEMCHLVRDVDYFVQASSSTEEGDSLRPDIRVKIPGSSDQLIIDSKAPLLEPYGDSNTSSTEAEITLRNIEFAKKVKARVTELSSKEYHKFAGNSLPYVVMFLPSESAIRAAFEADSDLLGWAHERKVMITSPATIMSLVVLIGSFKTRVALSENAVLLKKAVDELGNRLHTFFERLTKLQKGLEDATTSWNQAISQSWTGQKGVLRSLDKIREMDIGIEGESNIKLLDLPIPPPQIESSMGEGGQS